MGSAFYTWQRMHLVLQDSGVTHAASKAACHSKNDSQAAELQQKGLL